MVLESLRSNFNLKKQNPINLGGPKNLYVLFDHSLNRYIRHCWFFPTRYYVATEPREDDAFLRFLL